MGESMIDAPYAAVLGLSQAMRWRLRSPADRRRHRVIPL